MPLAVIFSTADSRDGIGKAVKAFSGPFTPAKSTCWDSEVNQSMNFAAACGYLASLGMPTPSGLLRLAVGPSTPGVRR